MEEKKLTNFLPTMMAVFLLSLILILNLSQAMAQKASLIASNEVEKQNVPKTYIVYIRKPEGRGLAHSDIDIQAWYKSFLPVTTTSLDRERRIVHSYKHVFTGFAAELTAEEAKAMEKKEGFVFSWPEKILPLHTTHSPSFLGLHQGYGFWEASNFGKGVIIGLLDTGLEPDHPSFSDNGVPPPPAKWKGKCEFDAGLCNNKLIGARNFVNSSRSAQAAQAEQPFDEEGHGTHTASTAAGNFVHGANVFGNANGTAVGMAPLAHLAIYKACSAVGCLESDILAALDAAVADGVDVISLSLGGGSVPFPSDAIAVGAFGAIQNGIFVSASAGNAGPFYGSLSNEAPWILTVGASTIDRSIRATARLGNGEEYDGETLFQPNNFGSPLLPLVYPGLNGNQSTAFCAPGAFENIDVRGKIVLCEKGGGIARIAKGSEVKNAGGAAMILVNQKPDGFSTLADAHVLPATHVPYTSGLHIKAYINSTSTPTATIIFKGTKIGDSNAPTVTSFSSRGPSLQSPGILKPDIIGPGVSILAAWPFPLDNNTNSKEVNFNIISGTSMSCPHLSGIAALLKSSHPDWSPAAIKSAIITTADILNLQGEPISDQTLLPADIFAAGAGHVNPSKANDPGFLYDIQPNDYVPYLCGLNYTDNDIELIVQHQVNCTEVGSISEAELNYPSFSVVLGSTPLSFTRTVTNVGPTNSSYGLEVAIPIGVDIIVEPSEIKFTEVSRIATYRVTFSRVGKGNVTKPFRQGFLNWVSDKYSVRSPIVVIFS